MTEQEARRRGYQFQGCYERSWNRDRIKLRAAQLRKEGNKAVMVNTRCGGCSVYWIESQENKNRRNMMEGLQHQKLLQIKIKETEDKLISLQSELRIKQKETARLQEELGL